MTPILLALKKVVHFLCFGLLAEIVLLALDPIVLFAFCPYGFIGIWRQYVACAPFI